MFSNILNTIPVIGHAKGIVHFALNDVEGGKTAMYESTRSTAVMAGGAIGTIGGPAGMAIVGAATGTLVDAVASVVSDKPQGTVACVDGIVKDAKNDKIPVGSVLKAGFMIGTDALCGLGGGGIVSNVAEKVGESTGKSLGKEVVKAVIKSPNKTALSVGLCAQGKVASKMREKTRFEARCTSVSISPISAIFPLASGSGSEPPRGNKGNGKKDHETEDSESDSEDELDHWLIFLKIFGAKSLDDICIRGRYPFKGLARGMKNPLKKLIKSLRAEGYLEETVKLVLAIFNSSVTAEKDVTFENFLSLAEFVASYIGELVARRQEILVRRTFGRTEGSFEARRQWTLRIVLEDIAGLTKELLNTFKDLWKEISKFTFDPYFRNIFAAIYHYYKHRVVPEKDIALSVSDYVDLIVSHLKKLKALQVYAELGPVRHEIVFDTYYDRYGGRVRIVVKFRYGKVVLSSCYIVVDPSNDDDEDGDEFIDSVKRN